MNETQIVSPETVTFSADIINLFWSRVEKTDSCWNWIGSINKYGYGRFHAHHPQVKPDRIGAHRFSWILARGLIPKKLVICHRCDNPKCVRPDHLFIGTQQDNLADCRNKNRHSKGATHGTVTMPESISRGVSHGMSKLTESKVIQIRELYASGSMFQWQIAEQFGITQTNVGFIIRRVTWTHVK